MKLFNLAVDMNRVMEKYGFSETEARYMTKKWERDLGHGLVNVANNAVICNKETETGTCI
jgi:hypothetical protein